MAAWQVLSVRHRSTLDEALEAVPEKLSDHKAQHERTQTALARIADP